MERNKQIKRYLSILILVFFMFSFMPAASFADNAVGGSSSNKTIDLSKYQSTTYYYNGSIITVDEKAGEDKNGNPIYAKAVLAGDGQIVSVAYTNADAAILENSAKKYNSKKVNLAGKTMIPAFVDSHSHIEMVDQYFDASPSSGVTSLETLVNTGKKQFNAWLIDDSYGYGPVTKDSIFWFVTNGFDNTAYLKNNFGKEPYAMPTKDILDKISDQYPICYVHASNHLVAVNSVGLERIEAKMAELKLTAVQQNAYKQHWDQYEDGSYTGILREQGAHPLYMLLPVLTDSSISRTAKPADVLANAMQVYASYGITTGVSGGGGNGDALYQKLASMLPEERIIDIQDMISYANREKVFGKTTSAASAYNEYGQKHGGVKLFLDGSPQGKTAWFAVDPDDTVSGGGYYRDANEKLLNTPDTWWYGEKEGKKTENKALTEQFVTLIQEGLQFTCHANGTGAIQQYIDCYRDALIKCGVDINNPKEVAAVKDRIRPVIIHGQTSTLEQVEACKKLGLNISYFTDHVYYYGDYHLESTIGPARGQLISPMADAMAGDQINITMHQDSPIAPPNMLFSVYNAANRITRDGKPIGRGSANGNSDKDPRISDWKYKANDKREERVSAYEALKCVTINGAWQNFEDDQKGSITAGKQADFVILNTNILTDQFLGLTPLEAMTGKFVEQTINNDAVIYEAKKV